MIRLVIWVTMPSGAHIRCGEMICGDPDSRGGIPGAFRYSDQWLDDSRGFALDPATLPLSDAEYACERPQGVFQVFEDSLPDDWGRRLLIRKAQLGRGRQNLPDLLQAVDGNALGALSFYPEQFDPQQPACASVLELKKAS